MAVTRLAPVVAKRRIPLLACGVALVLAGCGSSNDGTIPPQDSAHLLDLLAAAQSDAASGNCEFLAGHAQEVVDGVDALPEAVDPTVRSELTKAAQNLQQLAENPAECTATGVSGETGAQTTSSTTETTAPDTTTEPTTTESTTTEESTTTPQQPDEPNQNPVEQSPPGHGPDGTGPPAQQGPASGGVTGGGSAG